jgi:cytochrome oxidase Cu insertion factor (SCO1/SenC/PrrC family)
VTGKAEELRRIRTNQRTLLLIFAIPVVVIAVSGLLYRLADSGVMRFDTANMGTLINPPVQIEEAVLKDINGESFNYGGAAGHWLLVVAGDRHCAGVCERMLYLTRQVRVATGKKMKKVSRYYISSGSTLSMELEALLEQEHPQIGRLYGEGFQTLLGDDYQPNRFYLIDPRGWVMMHYQVNDSSQGGLNSLGKAVLKDMNRLIK